MIPCINDGRKVPLRMVYVRFQHVVKEESCGILFYKRSQWSTDYHQPWASLKFHLFSNISSHDERLIEIFFIYLSSFHCSLVVLPYNCICVQILLLLLWAGRILFGTSRQYWQPVARMSVGIYVIARMFPHRLRRLWTGYQQPDKF